MREITVTLFIFIALYTSVGATEQCSNVVEVSDGEPFLYELVNYNYTKTSDLSFSNCTCGMKKCFRKCCEVGYYVELPSKKCMKDPASDLLLNNGVDLYFHNSLKKNVHLHSYSAFVYGKPCEFVYFEDYQWYLQEVSLYTWLS